MYDDYNSEGSTMPGMSSPLKQASPHCFGTGMASANEEKRSPDHLIRGNHIYYISWSFIEMYFAESGDSFPRDREIYFARRPVAISLCRR